MSAARSGWDGSARPFSSAARRPAAPRANDDSRPVHPEHGLLMAAGGRGDASPLRLTTDDPSVAGDGLGDRQEEEDRAGDDVEPEQL